MTGGLVGKEHLFAREVLGSSSSMGRPALTGNVSKAILAGVSNDHLDCQTVVSG